MCYKIYIHVGHDLLNMWKFESSQLDKYFSRYGLWNFQFGVIIHFGIFQITEICPRLFTPNRYLARATMSRWRAGQRPRRTATRQPRRRGGPLVSLTWSKLRARRQLRRRHDVTPETGGTVLDGGGDTGHARGRGWSQTNERDPGDLIVAAPPSIAHWSDAGVHERRRRPTATARRYSNAGGRGQRGWGGARAHPWRVRLLDWRRRGPGRRRTAAAELGRPEGRRTRWQQLGAPRLDSTDDDIEDDEAFRLPPTAVQGGDYSGGERRFCPAARVRVRVSERGENNGDGQIDLGFPCFIVWRSRRERRRVELSSGGPSQRAVEQGAMAMNRGRGRNFCRNPPLLLPFSAEIFSHLIEAPRHLQTWCHLEENSYLG